MLGEFCKSVEKFLKKKGNVAAIHCKAGKGRTGLMICCLLQHLQHEDADTADRAMEFYAEKRTVRLVHAKCLRNAKFLHFTQKNKQGVTIPRYLLCARTLCHCS